MKRKINPFFQKKFPAPRDFLVGDIRAARLGCQEEKTSQRKKTGQKLQAVKSSHKDEETVTILCQFQFVKKFGFSCGESLWKSLWKMWKTLSYQQVFHCFEKEAAGIGKMGLCLRFFDRMSGGKTRGKDAVRPIFGEKVGFARPNTAKPPGSPKSAAENL